MKILLIDKDPAVIDVITLILESEGFEICVAKKPFEIQSVNDIMPDLILIHNGLNNEGSIICKQIKSSQRFNYIPIILTSTETNIIKIAKQSLADNYLLKPFDISELSGLIIETINGAQLRQK